MGTEVFIMDLSGVGLQWNSPPLPFLPIMHLEGRFDETVQSVLLICRIRVHNSSHSSVSCDYASFLVTVGQTPVLAWMTGGLVLTYVHWLYINGLF